MKITKKNTSTTTNARFFPRMIAYIIDLMLLGIPALIAFYWMFQVSNLSEVISRAVTALVLVSIPMMMVRVAYYVFFISKHGTTIGKSSLGLSISDENDKLLRPWWVVFREFVAKRVSGYLFGLGFAWIIKDKNNKAWHDMLAGTKVIQKENKIMQGLVTVILLLAVYSNFYYWIYKSIITNDSLFTEASQIIQSFL